MRSVPRKTIRGAPADKTVLLYVESENDQLVERARQLGVEAVAVPSSRKLVACTEEIWLPVSRFELYLWTKEAAKLLCRAPAVSRRMLCQGRRIQRVDNEDLDLLKDLVAEKTWSAYEDSTVNYDAGSAECAHSNACSGNYHAISSQAEGFDTAVDIDGW